MGFFAEAGPVQIFVSNHVRSFITYDKNPLSSFHLTQLYLRYCSHYDNMIYVIKFRLSNDYFPLLFTNK